MPAEPEGNGQLDNGGRAACMARRPAPQREKAPRGQATAAPLGAKSTARPAPGGWPPRGQPWLFCRWKLGPGLLAHMASPHGPPKVST